MHSGTIIVQLPLAPRKSDKSFSRAKLCTDGGRSSDDIVSRRNDDKSTWNIASARGSLTVPDGSMYSSSSRASRQLFGPSYANVSESYQVGRATMNLDDEVWMFAKDSVATAGHRRLPKLIDVDNKKKNSDSQSGCSDPAAAFEIIRLVLSRFFSTSSSCSSGATRLVLIFFSPSDRRLAGKRVR